LRGNQFVAPEELPSVVLLPHGVVAPPRASHSARTPADRADGYCQWPDCRTRPAALRNRPRASRFSGTSLFPRAHSGIQAAGINPRSKTRPFSSPLPKKAGAQVVGMNDGRARCAIRDGARASTVKSNGSRHQPTKRGGRTTRFEDVTSTLDPRQVGQASSSHSAAAAVNGFRQAADSATRGNAKTSQVCRSMLHSPRRRKSTSLRTRSRSNPKRSLSKETFVLLFSCLMRVSGTGYICARGLRKPPRLGGKRRA